MRGIEAVCRLCYPVPMTELIRNIEAYPPCNEQEARDKAAMLRFLAASPDALTRENTTAHLTASAWIVNRACTRVLMVYHNIFHSWSWTGGHADGDSDLLGVALREAREETGLQHVSPLSTDIFSLEVLTVDGHIKHGGYVSSHLHLNLTYLLAADENEPLTAKIDENSGVAWFSMEEAVAASSEPWFQTHIYNKLQDKLRRQGLI